MVAIVLHYFPIRGIIDTSPIDHEVTRNEVKHSDIDRPSGCLGSDKEISDSIHAYQSFPFKRPARLHHALGSRCRFEAAT